MATITREIWIDAPRAEVWDKALADFGAIYLWNPNVPSSHTTSTQQTGVGTTRHCDLTIPGASIEERVLRWEENKLMAIAIYDGIKTPPWKNPTATIELFDERGGTKVRGTLNYRMQMGPVGSLMDVLMVKPNFAKAWGAFHAGMKYFVEKGEKAADTKQLDLAAVAVVS